ncbi:transposase [Thermoflexus sp.]|uniref:transposase n=1 Tax=Thermoflexus sp. TaxID=1969742 RepID=UPI0035E4195E
MADLLQRAEAAGIESIIYVIIDDSLTRTDKDTTHLEAVDWVYDRAAAGKGQCLRFKTKYKLAREMLEELRPYLPKGYQVYVLFDRRYAAGKLIKWTRRQGWHVICALKSNRKLNGVQVDQWDQRLRHKRYTRARVPAADVTNGNEPLNCSALARSAPAAG